MNDKIIFQQSDSMGRVNFSMILSKMILLGIYCELLITDYKL